MSLFSLTTRHVFEPLFAFSEHSSHLKVLAEMEKSQFLTESQVRELQLQRLRRLLVHARENCPFYAERMAAAEFDPNRVTSLDDLRKLPSITKADIQQHRERMKAANIPDERLVPNQTGGSTGAPLKFYLDRERLFSRKASTMRHDSWSGWNVGEKMAILWGAPRDFSYSRSFKGRMRAVLLERRLMLDANGITAAKLAEFESSLKRYRPVAYLAYASAMYLYARYLREKGHRDYHRPQGIITSAEILTEEQRRLIEDVFGCKVYDRYGCRETSVVASECSEHAGMHINAESLYLEFIRRDRPCRAGEMGQVVITDLLNYGMPFIRYQIADMGIPLEGPCKCGRGLPRMQMAAGRVTEFLISPEGVIVSGVSLATYFITSIPGIAQAQLIQEKRDFVVVRLVCTEQFDNDSERIISEKIAEFFGPGMKYELQKVATIPLEPSGKHRFSICKLDPMEYLV